MKIKAKLNEKYVAQYKNNSLFDDEKKQEFSDFVNDKIWDALDNIYVEAETEVENLPEMPDEQYPNYLDNAVSHLVSALVKDRFSTLKESYKELNESSVRHYTEMLYDMMEDGLIDAKTLASDLMYWLSEDDVEHFMRVYDLLWQEDEEEENECLKEDTVKTKSGKWVNKGDTGETHGEFRTKKEADAQRKAMYAQGFKGGK